MGWPMAPCLMWRRYACYCRLFPWKNCDEGVAWFEEGAWNSTPGAKGGRTGLSVECSGGGICDHATGSCECRSDMFNGTACDVMDCPSCNDVGECRDMAAFAAVSKPRTAEPLDTENDRAQEPLGAPGRATREVDEAGVSLVTSPA